MKLFSLRRLLGRTTSPTTTARSSVPQRLPCANFNAVPPATELAAMAVVGRHVVLQFPRGSTPNKQLLIKRLASQLPGHRVFDSGAGPGDSDRITIYRVLDESVVLAHLSLFLAAIQDFAETARDCCHKLAAIHGAAVTDVLARRDHIEAGSRIGEWRFSFHGFGCCFTHHRTGQVVDVRLGFGDEFGVLDPYFLAQFIHSSANHREVAALLADDFHNMSRVLDILLAHGHLRLIEITNSIGSGMVMILVSHTDDLAQHRGEGLPPERGSADY